ncbi:hypothetical protein D3C87_1680450 [compost metagenome]
MRGSVIMLFNFLIKKDAMNSGDPVQVRVLYFKLPFNLFLDQPSPLPKLRKQEWVQASKCGCIDYSIKFTPKGDINPCHYALKTHC